MDTATDIVFRVLLVAISVAIIVLMVAAYAVGDDISLGTLLSVIVLVAVILWDVFRTPRIRRQEGG